MERYQGYATKRYGTSYEGHDVELEFDKKLIVLNRATLRVDGEVVDRGQLVLGEDDLRTTTADGVEIVVRIGSGLVGELVRAQLRGPGSTWIDLDEREPRE